MVVAAGKWDHLLMRAAVLACVLAAACGRGAPPSTGAPDGAIGTQPDAGVAPLDAGTPDGGAPDAGPVLHDGVLLGISGARYQSGATRGITDAAGGFRNRPMPDVSPP